MTQTRKLEILNASERLFAQRGLRGASLRQIAQLANVDLSLVTYHFKTKDQLFAAVIERRTEVFNREQEFYLEECERKAAPHSPELRDIVDAYSYVFIKRAIAGDEHWRDFFQLYTRFCNDPGQGADIMARYFDPIATRTIAYLRLALPDCDENSIQWGFQFLSGALVACLVNTGSVDRLSGGTVDSEDYREIHNMLVTFITAGLEKLTSTH